MIVRFLLCLLLVGCVGAALPFNGSSPGERTVRGDGKRQMLLYVADETLARVYSYPRGKLVGTLQQSSWIEGLCANAHTGDVFFVEINEVVEYSHGGSTPVETLPIPGSGFAQSCAVDANSGDLAVTSENPTLYIFPNGSGMPQEYNDLPGITGSGTVVYDGKSNLFVAGGYRSAPFALDEVSQSGAVGSISLPYTKTTPSANGGIQWDGKHIVVGDGQQTVYVFNISKRTGTLAGQVTLDDSSNVVGMTLHGDRLVVPNDDQRGHVRIYAYPAGGKPVKTLTGFLLTYGAVVSVPPK